MKGPGLLACLCWLLAIVGQTVQILPEGAGEGLVYEVESQVLSGIPDLADQYSGISLIYRLKVNSVSQNKYIFKIQDVRAGKINEEVPVSYQEDIDFQHKPAPIYERELGKPFAVHFDGYQIAKIVTQKSDPTWSVNMKKALAEKFQVDLKRQGPPASSRPNQVPRVDPTSPFYTVYEEGIGGECETRYSFQSVQSLDHPEQSEDVYNVTKVKNYRNCRSRPIFETDNYMKQGSPSVCDPKYEPLSKRLPDVWRESASVYDSGCHFGFEPDFHPVKSYAIVWYNVSRASHSPVIEGIIADGKTVYRHSGKELLVSAQMNITLVKRSSSRASVLEVPNPVVHESLEYEFPEEEYLRDEDSRIYALFGPVHIPDLLETFNRELDAAVSDLIPDEPETSQKVGPRIVQLLRAIDVFKRPELDTIFKELEPENEQKTDRKEAMKRKIFLDLLAISATDEVALFVHELFVNQRIKSWEATEIFRGLGKNVDDPAREVIDKYIQLLEKPSVQHSPRLYPTVAVTIGQMIKDKCVDEDEDPLPPQLQKDYKQPLPRHPRSLGKYDSEESSQEEPRSRQPKQPPPKKQLLQDEDECPRELFLTYVKTMAQKLRAAKKVGKIITHIEALAHMGSPEVVSYIKPYLTGDAPNLQHLDDEETNFVQVAAIYAVYKLAVPAADEILPIMADIYFDPSEDYESRIAAFHVIINTQPPLTLLERIMTELHTETSNQVASFVYSLCSEIANSTLPYERKLAQKMQLVLPHAPELDDIGLQYSKANVYTYYDDENDYGLKYKSAYVASNVSVIPRAFHHSLRLIDGPFRDTILQVGGRLKGIDELIEKLFQPGGIATQILSSLGSNVQVRNIPEILDVVKSRLVFKEQDVDVPRALLYYKLFGRSSFLSLDEELMVEWIEQILDFVRAINPSTGWSADYVKLWMPASFVRVVPSTVGLPVWISHRNPVILTVSLGNVRFSASPKKESPKTAAVAISAEIQADLHHASISLVSFLEPAHDQIYGAAVEKTTELSISNEVQGIFDLAADTYGLSWKPKLPHEIFYHDTRPMTFLSQAVIITEIKDEWADHVNEIETVPEPFKFEDRYEARPVGLSLRVSGDSESPWADIPLFYSETAEQEGIVAALLETYVNPELINRELHVYLEPHPKSPVSEILLTFDYDEHLKVGLPKSEEESQESSEEEDYEKAMSSIYGHSYVVPDAESTIEKLVRKTQASWAPVLGQGYEEPVPATITHVVEVTMAIKGQQTKQHAWRGVYAHSLDFRANYFQLFGHISGDEHQRPWQLCASGAVAYPQIPNVFYLEMNTLKSQKVKIEGEVGWGLNCQSENKIRLEGVMEKSEQQLSTSSGVYESEKDQQSLPWYYKQCQVDRTEGMTQSYACQKAISEDSELDLIKLDFIPEEVSPSIRNLTYQLDLWAKWALYPNLEASPFVPNPEDRVSVILHHSRQHPFIPLIDLEVHKPSESLIFSKLYWPLFEPPSTLDTYDEVFMDQLYNEDYYSSCNVMEDYINTFDNVTFELPDNKCQYVLAHDNSPDKFLTVIVSQVDLRAKTKALSMSLASHTIKVLPPQGEEVPIVLNGKEHEVTPQTPIVLDFDSEYELFISVIPTASSTDTPILVIEARGVSLKYDGKNVELKLSRSFQGDQMGLCGDFNDEEYYEFIGPNGCRYVEEEDFANSYAIPGQNCAEPPKPKGPAFCAKEIVHAQDKNKRHQHDHQASESVEDYSPKHPKPMKPKHQRHQESEEEPEVRPSRYHKKQRPHTSMADSAEELLARPEGSPSCVQEYTDVFEDKAKKVTCFATLPTYKCRQGCRPVSPKKREVPYHCLPEASYVKPLKEEARHSVVPQVQNKKPEMYREIDWPEKCL